LINLYLSLIIIQNNYVIGLAMAKVKIDDKEYEVDDMSDELKSELGMLADVDRRLRENDSEKAILQTAKNAYSRRVEQLLPKETN
jgi:hypothetical protein